MKMNANEKKRSSTRPSNHNSDRQDENSKRRRVTLLESDKHKKIYSFDDLVEIMKPSREELEYRIKECENVNAIEKYSKLFKCTKCQSSFKSIIENHEKVPTHPCLGVLMCQKCCNYYLDGEFSVDSEGEEKYCRWCGEGGVILGCSNCICGFCANCIKKHWDNKYLKKVKSNDTWICFFCDPKPLWKHRFICSLAVSASKNDDTFNTENTKEEEKNLSSLYSELNSSTDMNSAMEPAVKNVERNSGKLIICSLNNDSHETQKIPLKESELNGSSCTSTYDSIEQKKSDALIELGKVLKLSENHMNFGKAWVTKKLKKFTNPDYLATRNDLVNECQKIKQFLSLLSTYLVQFSNSVESIEQSLQNDLDLKNSCNIPENDNISFNTILQFLGFVNNQVKIFMEKGITLSDILEPEVYDNGDVVGIKKKSNIHSNEKEKTGVNSVDFDDIESKEEDQKMEWGDRSKIETSPDIISSQNTEVNSSEGSDEQNASSNFSLTTDIKTTDPKEEIQEILAILENA